MGSKKSAMSVLNHVHHNPAR